MKSGDFHRLVQLPLAATVACSVELLGPSGATASTSPAAVDHHMLADALSKKYVIVTGTATAANFKGDVTDLSGPTFAQETSTSTYSGPPSKLVTIIAGKSL